MQHPWVNRAKGLLTIRNITFCLSVFIFVSLVYYYLTGKGGGLWLSVRFVPLCVVTFICNKLYTRDYLYPKISDFWNRLIGFFYIFIVLMVYVYLLQEFGDIFALRTGSYNQMDFIMGLSLFFVIMEISRKIHPILFWVNMVLIVYNIFGYLSPINFFWHPGVSLEYIINSSTVTFATGIFSVYTQLALTLIAAFLMLAAVAQAFGAQNAIINFIKSFAKTNYKIPLVAVLSSSIVGSVSGSGAANTAITGNFTIPLMIKNDFPPVYAGAVETAASMGGLIMPPLMGVAGFLMAEFLGVPYWDVVIRGFALAFVYYSALVLTVYLLSLRYIGSNYRNITPHIIPMYDKLKVYAFFTAIITLIILMGVIGMGPIRAAVYTSFMFAGLMLCIYIYYKYMVRDESFKDFSLFKILQNIINTHIDMTCFLVILLAILGIMINLFTASGFIMRMGSLIMNLGETSIILTILAAWVFGWLAGTGLPPVATYIVVAIIIVRPFAIWGIDPWVTHFFVFLISIWGELSPPTSLTAAVASRISNASFMRTMMVALKICAPIFILSFTIFVRSDILLNPGILQIRDTLLITIGTLGIIFCFFGRFTYKALFSYSLKILLATVSVIILFHPSLFFAIPSAAIVFAALVVGIIQQRKIDLIMQVKKTVA